MVRTLFLLVALSCITLMPFASSHAADDGSLDVSIAPQYPRPNSIVILTPVSASLDLPSASVSVSVEGKVVATGVGTDSFSIPLSAPGKPVHIQVSAKIGDQTYTKTFFLAPQDISLVLEPQTTSHPFYGGASLISPGGTVRAVALADFRTQAGTRVSPSSLVYTWSAGDQVLTAQSGLGKNTLTATAPPRYRNTSISVSIQTVDHSLVGGASVPIVSLDPLVRIYKNDPLLGPEYDDALSGSATMSGSEETFRVTPYFFASFPSIAWTVNSVLSGADKDITLRPTGTGSGNATLGVTASKNDVLQSASQNLSVSFGASQSLGIFGL